ncbi:hypothetical protein [Subtercola sp. RTI3]|nr:hypothetical protein [Subtercola sp. RTI3]MEA9985945.1 hypothetical protein [Subtercola sp. RTI3]
MPRHIRNALIVAVSLMLVVTGSFAAFSIHEYVYPASDQPTKSDVIVVLGPPEATRIAIAQKMLDAGLSQNLLVSVPA